MKELIVDNSLGFNTKDEKKQSVLCKYYWPKKFFSVNVCSHSIYSFLCVCVSKWLSEAKSNQCIRNSIHIK